MNEQLKPCPLTWAIQRINSTPYSLTKDECVDVLRGLRDEIRALTTCQPAQAGEVDERVAFEVWARPHGYDIRRNAVLGHYSSIDTLRAWNGWQARASLPTQPAAQSEPSRFGSPELQAMIVQHATQQATPDHVPDAGKMIQATPEPVLLNGLTEAETNATASVMGLTATPDVPETDFGNMATQQAAGEPVADVPIHPRQGPLWANVRPRGADTPIPSYPTRPLIFADTHQAPGVPEIDYSALIHAAWGKHKYAQGTGGCIAFKRGAEWFRDIALSAAHAKGGA